MERRPVRWIVATAVAWAALCVWLAQSGEVPSRPPPWSDATHHYAWQAALMAPMLWLMWRLLGRVAHAVARPTCSAEQTLASSAAPFALPILLGVVLPDALVYGLAGFETLADGVRVYGPLSLLVSGVWLAQRMRNLPAVTAGRAWTAAALSLAAAWTLGGVVLR